MSFRTRFPDQSMQEPAAPRVLIGCQIQTGPGMTWTNRTYEVARGVGGWRIFVDSDPIALGRCSSWADVLAWLSSLRPRDVEILEAA